jgi:hypothetical protein
LAEPAQATTWAPDAGVSTEPEPGAAPAIAGAVTAQVQVILEAAERAAAEIQREVDEETARRAAEVRLAAERDAERIRSAAEAQAGAYLLEARQAVDAFARERLERLARLTDDLLAGSQAVLGRIDEAAQARRALDELMAAIVATAEATAHVAAEPPRVGAPAGAAPAGAAPAGAAPAGAGQ